MGRFTKEGAEFRMLRGVGDAGLDPGSQHNISSPSTSCFFFIFMFTNVHHVCTFEWKTMKRLQVAWIAYL